MPRERKGALISRFTKRCICSGKCTCKPTLFARVRYVDSTGRQRSKERKVANRSEGRELIKQWLRDIDDEGGDFLAAAEKTFADLAAEYEKLRLIPAQYAGSSDKPIKVAGRRSLGPVKNSLSTLRDEFGRKLLRSITYVDLELFRTSRLAEPVRDSKGKVLRQRSIAAVNRDLEVLRAMFRFAISLKWLRRSPFADGRPLISKADETSRERVLTAAEEQLILGACDEPFRTIKYRRQGSDREMTVPNDRVFTDDKGVRRTRNDRKILKAIIILAIDTAMRRNEILTLTWGDVDFGKRIVKIRAFNSKTAKAREVGMTPRVVAELSAIFETSSRRAADRVFGIHHSFKISWNSLRKEVGLTDLRFHDLRHTATTRMIQANIPPAEVMKITGHTQMKTFLRYINPDAMAAVSIADRLAAFNQQNESAAHTLISPFEN